MVIFITANETTKGYKSYLKHTLINKNVTNFEPNTRLSITSKGFSTNKFNPNPVDPRGNTKTAHIFFTSELAQAELSTGIYYPPLHIKSAMNELCLADKLDSKVFKA